MNGAEKSLGNNQPLHADTVHVIRDVETLRVVADATRLRMLELIRGAPRTVKEIAGTLGLPQTKLYYHVRLLEEHGLIEVADTRVVSGIIEKHYQTSAYRFTVDRALLPGAGTGDPALDVMLSVILDEAAGEIRRSVEVGLIELGSERLTDRGLLLGRAWLRLTAEQAQQLSDQITDSLKQFAGQPDEEPSDAQTYEVLMGIFPTLRGADTDKLHVPLPDSDSRD